MAAAFELGIPVTPRGTGTGNYGQAMPLSGGIVLDLSGFNTVRDVQHGRVVSDPGTVLARIDEVTRPTTQQELRLHPSTYNTASIGGFIAGGSGGVGSIRWGGLRDFGNVIRLQVATMEASPRVLELTGRGPAEGQPRLWHQRHHHAGRDAAGPGLSLGGRHRRLRRRSRPRRPTPTRWASRMGCC